LVVEVLSESTEENDRGVKFMDYQAHGVGEYWIIDAHRKILEQYVLSDSGRFELRMKSASGMLASHAVPAFCVPVAALFDTQANSEALRAMLAP
jgi:Uma2 family endonuclease